MIYIVIKEKGGEASIQEFQTGVAFTAKNLDKVEWLYFAKSKADAQIALDTLPDFYGWKEKDE